MRILHLPETVGGNPWGLAQGERKIGLDPTVLSLYRGKFQYDMDICMNLDGKGELRRFLGHAWTFLKYRTGFDVYHFNFGTTPLNIPRLGLNMADLPFYDRRAKKIITYQGCDARQKYPTMERARAEGSPAACFEAACYNGMCNSERRDKERRAAIDKAAKYVDHMFALNPDLMFFLPKGHASFLPYTLAGHYDMKTVDYCPPSDRPLRIVHAPTQRATKGTRYILAALEELADEFPGRFEVRLIENMTNAQALEAYRSADILIDQALIGWYGRVATEAMRMGVPVACFINENHLHFIPEGMARDIPVIRITPSTVKEALRPYIKEPARLMDVSTRSVQYVLRWHDPENIARYVQRAYLGGFPGALTPLEMG